MTGNVLQVQPPRLLEYRFGMGDGAAIARVKMKVVITNDAWEDDPAYAQTADGRPRIPPAGEGKNVPPALSGSLAFL